MLTLAIVTCGPQLEVALEGEPLRGVSSLRLAGRSPRSTLLMAGVDLLFEDAEISAERLERVLVTRGPGSFTGIRAGLASAAGLAAATGATALAFDSLGVLAGRVAASGEVWAAQPGRRGEVYVQPFDSGPGNVPQATGPLRVVAVDELAGLGPWVAAETLDLGPVHRAVTACSTAESLLRVDALGLVPGPLEPMYVEGHPARRRPAR